MHAWPIWPHPLVHTNRVFFWTESTLKPSWMENRNQMGKHQDTTDENYTRHTSQTTGDIILHNQPINSFQTLLGRLHLLYDQTEQHASVIWHCDSCQLKAIFKAASFNRYIHSEFFLPNGNVQFILKPFWYSSTYGADAAWVLVHISTVSAQITCIYWNKVHHSTPETLMYL